MLTISSFTASFISTCDFARAFTVSPIQRSVTAMMGFHILRQQLARNSRNDYGFGHCRLLKRHIRGCLHLDDSPRDHERPSPFLQWTVRHYCNSTLDLKALMLSCDLTRSPPFWSALSTQPSSLSSLHFVAGCICPNLAACSSSYPSLPRIHRISYALIPPPRRTLGFSTTYSSCDSFIFSSL